MNPDVNDNALDGVLSGREEIIPSSGFVASVMEAVQQEATVPAPIPFPWKQAIPGLIASIGLVVFFLIRLAHAGMRGGYDAAGRLRMESLLSMQVHGWAAAPLFPAIQWSVLALLVSFVTVRLSMRIGRG